MTTYDALRLQIETKRRKRAEAEAAGEEVDGEEYSADDLPQTIEESVERFGPRANQF